jgi:PAS domain-containing protein
MPAELGRSKDTDKVTFKTRKPLGELMQTLLDENYFRGILDAVPAGILMIDAERHRITYANPAILCIVGTCAH